MLNTNRVGNIFYGQVKSSQRMQPGSNTVMMQYEHPSTTLGYLTKVNIAAGAKTTHVLPCFLKPFNNM